MVVGIDPSTFHVAICVTDLLLDGTVELKKHILRTQKQVMDQVVVADAYRIARQLGDTLPTNRTVYAFLELPVVGARGGVQTALKLGYVNGALQAGLIEAGFEVHLVQNTEWKKEVVGSGSAKKPAIASAIQRLWPKAHGICSGDQDLLDACGINLHGARALRRASGMDGRWSLPGDGR